jgi:hypothetical protein
MSIGSTCHRPVAHRQEQPDQSPPATAGTDIKSLQAAKIGELRQALIAEGYHSLDQQARALGLARSTAWSILKANHKSSGLSAAIINRMLAAPDLPPRVRLKIYEYLAEKRAGHFGHSRLQLRRFSVRLSAEVEERGMDMVTAR